MPIVNYVREHMRFMEYATDEHLTASERLLWYALMHVMNQRAQGKVWPDEFIRISNDRLLSYCPMKYDTIASARNSLKQRGLIEFTPGEKNKKSPSYRMIYFYPEYIAPQTDIDTAESYPNNPEYIGGNIGGNLGGNLGGNIGDIYINNINKRIPNTQQIRCDEEDEKQNQLYACARAEAETAWRAYFGKQPTPAMTHDLAWRAVSLGFDQGVLTRAIKIAASKGTNSPTEYVITVLCDWSMQNVKTVEDAEEYAFIFDAMSGKYPAGMTPDEGYEAAKTFRQERKAREEKADNQEEG